MRSSLVSAKRGHLTPEEGVSGFTVADTEG